MVRKLDLKKPPSIAESIDWARAMIAARRDRHRPLGVRAHDEHHREAPHRPRRGGRARGREARRWNPRQGRTRVSGAAAAASTAACRRACRPGSRRSCVRFCEELRSEGVKIGTAELLDAFGALGEVSWTDREDFRETLAATLAKSQEDRRVFELVFDRFFFRAVEAQAVEKGLKETRFEGGERIDLDDLRQQIQDAIRAGQRRRDGRPRAARGRRVRRPGRELGRDRRGRAAHPPHARAAPAAAATATQDGDGARPREPAPLRGACCAASWSAR